MNRKIQLQGMYHSDGYHWIGAETNTSAEGLVTNFERFNGNNIIVFVFFLFLAEC